MSLKRHGDYWYPLSPISAPYWGFRYRCGSLAESESTTFEFAGQVASQYGDWSNRFNWDARGATMTCICTPAIAGKKDYDRISEAVLPYVEHHDTFTYVTDKCPAVLSNLYAGIVQAGYANGFL